MDVSVIIVNYNTKYLTINCLRSVYSSETGNSYEILMVDNASTDGSVEAIRSLFPEVRIIENNQNVGFARANNQAAAIASGRYLYILNSDTEIEKDVIEKTVSFGDLNEDVGIIGTKAILPDKTIQENYYKFPTLLSEWIFFVFGIIKSSSMFLFKTNKYKTEPNLSSPFEVDVISGTSMFVKREVYEKCGLFNNEFFMYYEDVEFCYRVKKHGFKRIYLPTIKVDHIIKGSSRNYKDNLKVLIACFRSCCIYFGITKNWFFTVTFKTLCFSMWFLELIILRLILILKKDENLLGKIYMLQALLSVKTR